MTALNRALCRPTPLFILLREPDYVSAEACLTNAFSLQVYIYLQTVGGVSGEVIEARNYHFYNYNFAWDVRLSLQPEFGLTKCNRTETLTSFIKLCITPVSSQVFVESLIWLSNVEYIKKTLFNLRGFPDGNLLWCFEVLQWSVLQQASKYLPQCWERGANEN